MVEGSENRTREEFRGARVRVFGTDPDNPEEGRIFVWTKMGWFERVKGPSGGVGFIPVAQSENELREFILRHDSSVDLVPLGGNYRRMISEEFMEQSPAYSDSPEYSSEDPDQADDQQYHQHDL
jgi:hypothetical protein